jgi:hypothetical protein
VTTWPIYFLSEFYMRTIFCRYLCVVWPLAFSRYPQTFVTNLQNLNFIQNLHMQNYCISYITNTTLPTVNWCKLLRAVQASSKLTVWCTIGLQKGNMIHSIFINKSQCSFMVSHLHISLRTRDKQETFVIMFNRVGFLGTLDTFPECVHTGFYSNELMPVSDVELYFRRM